VNSYPKNSCFTSTLDYCLSSQNMSTWKKAVNLKYQRR
jgi:hypothetical protein